MFSWLTEPNQHVQTRQGAYSQVSPAYIQAQTITYGTCILIRRPKARFRGVTDPNWHEHGRAHSCRGVQPGFLSVQTHSGSNGHVHARQGAYSPVLGAYKLKWARTDTYTLMQVRTARFPRRTVPNGHERVHAHSSEGLKPDFGGVRTQTGTIGDVHTCARTYTQVFRAYRPKRARTGTCTHVQGRTARFPGRTGPDGHKRARAQLPRDEQPGFPGLEQARTYSSGGVKPVFWGVQAETGSNGHLHTR